MIYMASHIILGIISGFFSIVMFNDYWKQLLIQVYSSDVEETEVVQIIEDLEKILPVIPTIDKVDQAYLDRLVFLDTWEKDEIMGIKSRERQSDPDSMLLASTLDPVKIELIKYFIQFDILGTEVVVNKRSNRNSTLFLSSQLSTRYPTPVGYHKPDPYYLGSHHKIRNHLRVRSDEIDALIVNTKNPGQQWFFEQQYGTLNGYIILDMSTILAIRGFMTNRSYSLLLGDFRVQQGLGMISNGSAFSTPVAGLAGRSLRVNPVLAGASPNSVHGRGGIMNIAGDRYNLYAGVSHRTLPTNVSNSGDVYYPSWRTEIVTTSQLKNRPELTLTSLLTGFNVRLNTSESMIQIQSSVIYHTFNRKIIQRSGYWNTFSFEGSESLETSVAATLQYKDHLLISEFAATKLDNYSGILIYRHRTSNQNVGMWFRFYQPGFNSVWGSAPVMSKNQVASGFSFRIRPLKNLTLINWGELSHTLTPPYGYLMPTTRHEFGTASDLRIKRSVHLNFKNVIRTGYRSTIESDEHGRDRSNRISEDHHNFSVQMRLTGRDLITTEVKLQLRSVKSDYASNSRGIALSGGLTKRFMRYSLFFQHIVFETKDYRSRVYHYEYGPTYSMSVHSLYGMGHRTNFMIHTNIFQFVDTRIKLARTQYNDRMTVGSGQNSVNSPVQTLIEVQLTKMIR